MLRLVRAICNLPTSTLSQVQSVPASFNVSPLKKTSFPTTLSNLTPSLAWTFPQPTSAALPFATLAAEVKNGARRAFPSFTGLQQIRWQVLTITATQHVFEDQVTPHSLSLDPRDVNLFNNAKGQGNQRATIEPRELGRTHEPIILFCTEIVRAIIYKDKTILFPHRRQKDTVRTGQTVYTNICQDVPYPLSFELRVLEALLSETARSFASKTQRLRYICERIVADIDQDVADLHRLVPIQRAMNECQQDVREAREAVEEILHHPTFLTSMCLTPLTAEQPGSRPMHEVSATLLESYERQLETTEGILRETVQNLESSRDLWAVQLDSTRNRIIRIEVVVAIASFALLLCTVPASFFGMNLTSGLEDTPNMFWPVVLYCMASSTLCCVGAYAFWRLGPSRRKRQISDLQALQTLLAHHFDDVEDVMIKLWERPGIKRKDFASIVTEACGPMTLGDNEIDLLWKVFDSNRDGFLEISEVVRYQHAPREQLHKKL